MAARLSYRPRIWREAASLILAVKSTVPASASKNNKEINRPPNSTKPIFGQQDTANYKLLLTRRVSTMKFMPNVIVFPGGQLDASDMSVEWLNFFEEIGLNKANLIESLRIFGPRPLLFTDCTEFDKASSKDAISPILPLDIAFRLCAIRETFEECGVLITRAPSTVSRDLSLKTLTCNVSDLSESDILHWQDKVAKDGKQFMNLCKEKNLCPDLWALHEWSDWLTPTNEFPVRFDTIFYIALIENLKNYNLSTKESTDIMFSTPLSVLNDYYKSNNLSVFPPQYYEIARMATVNDFDKLASFAVQREPLGLQCCFPVRMLTPDGEIHLFPGDDMYPQAPDFIGSTPKISTPMTIEAARLASQNLCRVESLSNNKLYILRCNIKEPFGHISPLVPQS